RGSKLGRGKTTTASSHVPHVARSLPPSSARDELENPNGEAGHGRLIFFSLGRTSDSPTRTRPDAAAHAVAFTRPLHAGSHERCAVLRQAGRCYQYARHSTARFWPSTKPPRRSWSKKATAIGASRGTNS